MITRRDNFFLCTTYRKEQLHNMTIFLYTHLPQKNIFTIFTTEKIFSNFTRIKECMHVATGPTYGPLLILSPALKGFGPPPPPRRQGLCHQWAHLWPTSDFVPRSEALGTPQTAGVR